MKQPSVPRRRALLSVYDKSGLVDFARGLANVGFELVSTGGTAKALREAGLTVTDVAQITGFPAILHDRVKTLHPKIMGGILAAVSDASDQTEMKRYKIEPFDLVVVNLYPFESNPSIELIDIGGPTMIRAAAKNHDSVGVVINPSQYELVQYEIETWGALSDETRRALAAEVFALTASYDLRIADWLSDGKYKGFIGQQVETLKYGENAWQAPAFVYAPYGQTNANPLWHGKVIDGGNRSLVGVIDERRALQVLTHALAGFHKNFQETPQFIAVAVKHGNACGAAIGRTAKAAIRKMIDGDPESIFGGVIMTTFPITKEVAQEMKRSRIPGQKPLYDAIIAPGFDPEAQEILHRAGGRGRLVTLPLLLELHATDLDQAELWKPLGGGYFGVEPGFTQVLDLRRSVVHGAKPTRRQQKDLVLAWAIMAPANSNSIAIVKNGQLLALGTGQQSRIGCAELARDKARKAGHDLFGAVMCGDSFNPFNDVVRLAGRLGIAVVFASARPKPTARFIDDPDQASIQAAEGFDITLLLQPDAEVRAFAGHGL